MAIPTSSIFETIGFKLTGECSCGRHTNVLHCPYCGSTGLTKLKRLSQGNVVLLVDGSRVPDIVVTCKICGRNFPESNCFRTCMAMPVSHKRESELVEQGARIPQANMDLLKALARKNPRYAEQIKAKLGDKASKLVGGSLLEQVEQERAKNLFEKPKLDEEES